MRSGVVTERLRQAAMEEEGEPEPRNRPQGRRPPVCLGAATPGRQDQAVPVPAGMPVLPRCRVLHLEEVGVARTMARTAPGLVLQGASR